MKKLLYSIIFIIILSIFYTVSATNNENNIQNAILIEKYIVKHKSKIETFINKYNIKNSNINKNLAKLDNYILLLNKIKENKIKDVNSEKIIQKIIQKIKEINTILKQNLYKEKIKFQNTFQKKKNIYSKLGIKLSTKIDKINIKILKYILSNKNISEENKKKIKNTLLKLNKESKKLKSFGKINFRSEKELKDSFIRILKNIKREANIMKTILK